MSLHPAKGLRVHLYAPLGGVEAGHRLEIDEERRLVIWSCFAPVDDDVGNIQYLTRTMLIPLPPVLLGWEDDVLDGDNFSVVATLAPWRGESLAGLDVGLSVLIPRLVLSRDAGQLVGQSAPHEE